MFTAGCTARFGHQFTRTLSCPQLSAAVHNHLPRFKSDKPKQPSDVIVEKEKKKYGYEPQTYDWDTLPEKLSVIKEGFKEIFKHPTKQRKRGRLMKDDEILYYFRDAEDLENWYIKTDEEVGGKSWAEFVLSENGMTAAYRGFISQRLPRYLLPSSHDKLEEKVNYNGFSYLETKPFLTLGGRDQLYSIQGFNTFEIKLRGDGRRYFFEMMCELNFMEFMYTIPIYTRGGPEWQTVQLPYSKFIASKRSAFLVSQEEIDVNRIKNFRFLISDGIQGPFQLEIDYIAMRTDLTEAGQGSDYWDPNKDTNAMIGTW